MSLGRRKRAAIASVGATRASWGAIAGSIRDSIGIGAAAPGTRRRRDADLEIAHEPEEIGLLEPERPGRACAVAAGLGQGRLDQPPLELTDGAVIPVRPGTRRRSWSRRRCAHATHLWQSLCHGAADAKSTGCVAPDTAAAAPAVRAANEDAAAAGHARETKKRGPKNGSPLKMCSSTGAPKLWSPA